VSRVLPSVAVAVLAASGWACSAQQRESVESHGISTPLGVDAGAPAPPKSTVAEAATDLDLLTFAPLLSLPELAEAAAAVEAERYSKAALLVAEAMIDKPPLAGDVPRWQFLLARLREAAGQLTGAAASYDLAASSPWPLTGYARLGAGRVLVRAGRHEEALARLKEVPLDQPLAAETRLLLAEVAAKTGDGELAIDTWREHLNSAEEPEDAAMVSMRLAEALVAQVEAGPVGDAGRPAANAGAAPADAGAVPAAASADRRRESLLEALDLARRVRLRYVRAADLGVRAAGLEQRILGLLPEVDKRARELLSPEEQLVHIRGLEQAHLYTEMEEAAERLVNSLRKSERWGLVGCEASLLLAKGLGGNRTYGKAAEVLRPVVQQCQGDDMSELRPRALYLAGKYSARDGRHTAATNYYAQLEKEFPEHRLADDARLNAALSYYSLGVEARFTELLASMPEDYPGGDMMLDGVFRLALRRIEKQDWSGAASVLDRAASVVGRLDSGRGMDFSGRERYWRARAWIETGESERGLDELEALVEELPFSYYMLQAYTQLERLEPERARRARRVGVERSEEQPFQIEFAPELDTPGFRRAMELMRVGEIERGEREIEALGVAHRGTAPKILWGISLLYAKAGSADLSHRVARSLLTDWLQRWPAGDWTLAWTLAYPRPYPTIVEREAEKAGIAAPLVYGIMREESAFDPQAQSPANAYGLMQLIVPTARSYGKKAGIPWTPAALMTPRTNIALGCRVLGDLSERFAKNPLLAIPGYNAGPGRPQQWAKNRTNADFDLWVELIPFRETRRYTKRVLASRAAYAFLYAPQDAERFMSLPTKLGY